MMNFKTMLNLETMLNLTRSILDLKHEFANINNINMLKIKNINIGGDLTPYTLNTATGINKTRIGREGIHKARIGTDS